MKVGSIPAIYFILIIVNIEQGASFINKDIKDVLEFAHNVASIFLEGADFYTLFTDKTDQKLDNIHSSIQNIMRDQQLIANRLERNIKHMLSDLRENFRNDAEFDRLKEKLTQDYIARINNIHKSILDAIQRKYNNITICNIADRATSYGSHEIQDSLGKTDQLISAKGMPSYFSNFISIIVKYYQKKAYDRCDRGVSIQQEIYQLYELVAFTEQKAFTALILAYAIKSKCHNANFTNEITGVQTDSIDRIRRYLITIKETMAKVSTEIRRCEPSKYIRDENFFEFERFHNLLILREEETTNTTKCDGECHWFSPRFAPKKSKTIDGSYIHTQQCIKCESTGNIRVCRPTDESNHLHYYGAYFVSKNFSGTARSLCECHGHRGYESICGNFNTYLDMIIYKCDMCMCRCMDYEIDVKYRYSFSLLPQNADITKNMVVTGIKFNKTSNSKSGQIIYPQIKVGKLLPGGDVSEDAWQDVGPIGYDTAPMKGHGIDYALFSQQSDHVRFINIDDAYALPGWVVTGVMFYHYIDMYSIRRPYLIPPDHYGKSISLVVRMTRFNLTTGKLLPGSTYSHPELSVREITGGIGTPDIPWRSDIHMDNLDIPTKSSNVKPNRLNRAYVRMTVSDIKSDLGQSTVPFFDLQPVETSPASPLSGVGLFYKNAENFSGFLALKIMTLNLSDIVNTGEPKSNQINLGLPDVSYDKNIFKNLPVLPHGKKV